ncbi:MAG: hypothetical protein CSA95_06870 [Bacteroidetes bacterium]|nr:MAG: hypothetical protein CSA95_06870 [Bacteroidota bacterium]PIE88515.1 MAG: hypothetical protein CSA04_01595 [Bacteroidota bacterium]
MKKELLLTLSILVLALCFSACNEEPPQEEVPTLALSTFQAPAPFDCNTETLFYHDIAYGDFERNRFDLFAPVTDHKTPLVIYIHGGGFAKGDKEELYDEPLFQTLINQILDKKIAVATFNYRFIEAGDGQGVLKSLNDCKRGLQFTKYFAEEMHIDKERIILMGASAGAGTGLWLGLSDNMALSEDNDPILRESTRVLGIVGIETQASYDILSWPQSVFGVYEEQGMSLDTLLQTTGEETLLVFYGVSNIEELYTEELQATRARLDMLSLLSEDDPEIYLASIVTPNTFPSNKDEILHHPLHAKAILDKATTNHVACKAFIPLMGINNTDNETPVDFIIRIAER